MFDLQVERDGSRGPVRRLRVAAVVAEMPQRVQEEAGVRLQQEAPCLLQRPHGAGGSRRGAQGEQARHRRDRGVRRRAAPRARAVRVHDMPPGGRQQRRDDRPRPERKVSCEKNHEEIRKLLSKGRDDGFEQLTRRCGGSCRG